MAGFFDEMSEVLANPTGAVNRVTEQRTHGRGWKEGGHVATYLSTSVRVRVSGKTGTNFWLIHLLFINGPVVGLERFLDKDGSPIPWGMAGEGGAAVHIRSNRIPIVR
jgi:hypothetical protein